MSLVMVEERSTGDSLYLDLLKKCLTRSAFGDSCVPFDFQRGGLRRRLYSPVRRWLAARGIELVRRVPFDAAARVRGLDWPAEAETMIGIRRLDNIEYCVHDVVARGTPGDLIETGVWSGGAAIFMRAVLKVCGDQERTVWAADSFDGLPKPDAGRCPADAGDRLWMYPQLAVSLDEVKANFARYGLLDDQVRFLVGWFRDTLPAAPLDRVAVLRLDGDLYESTMDSLCHLYPKVSVGGYVIVDDYGSIAACRAAVDEFRSVHSITDRIVDIDGAGVFWQRLR